MLVQNDAEKNRCVPLHPFLGGEERREEQYKKKEGKQEAPVAIAQGNKRRMKGQGERVMK